VSSADHDPLYDIAVAATGSIPATWRRTGPQRLLGQLRGVHGSYRIGISTIGGRLYHVKVSSLTPVPEPAVARIDALCMDANWQMPTAAFSYSAAGDGAVMTQAAIALDRTRNLPDPALYRNLLRECILNSELLAKVVDAVNLGCSIEDARTFRAQLYPELYQGRLGGLPAYLTPSGTTPASPSGLIAACEAATISAGWETLRPAPEQLIVVCAGSPATGPVHTVVDVHGRSLIFSSQPFSSELLVPEHRRPAVSELLNRILAIGVPFGLALDLQSGSVVARSFLELSGVAQAPSPELLCDVIFQSAAGAFLYLDPIVAVAHEGADPKAALAEHVARQQIARRAS
jgi:hypothetical protein